MRGECVSFFRRINGKLDGLFSRERRREKERERMKERKNEREREITWRSSSSETCCSYTGSEFEGPMVRRSRSRGSSRGKHRWKSIRSRERKGHRSTSTFKSFRHSPLLLLHPIHVPLPARPLSDPQRRQARAKSGGVCRASSGSSPARVQIGMTTPLSPLPRS